jgi:fructose/tagatose bisphosphate aldolase
MRPISREMASPSSGTHASYDRAYRSSHMVDLSEEPKAENIALTKKYLQRAAPMKQWLEMEIGITGGEEEGNI